MNGKLKLNSKLIFSEKKIINYEIFSDLKGLGILLPDPFKKNNAIQKDFIRGKIDNKRSHKIDVKYGSDINSTILYKNGNFNSSINIGVAGNKIPSNGLVININENEFNLDKWINFIKSINSKSVKSNNNVEVNIKTRALIMVNRYFNDVDLQIKHKQDGIYTIINSPKTVGKLNLKKINNQNFIYANFEKLQINEAIILKKIKKLPPSMNLTCAKCSFKDIQLGSIILEARNIEQNIFSTDILKISNNNDFELIGKLSTSITDNEYDNYGSFDLIFDNFGKSLSRLKVTDSIENGKGLVDAQIKWKGNKIKSFLYSLNGNTNIDLKSGFFKKIDPGVGKLLGIFSLQSIPKRLLLDFSDVYKEGFYFDKLIANANASDGIFKSDNIKMLGPSGSLSFDGEVDMRSQTQNLNFVIYPTITTAAALAGAVINPAVGIATFVIQKLFKDPIEKKAARMYKVTGTWSKPQIIKIEK